MYFPLHWLDALLLLKTQSWVSISRLHSTVHGAGSEHGPAVTLGSVAGSNLNIPFPKHCTSMYICFCWTLGSINLIKIIWFGLFQCVDTSPCHSVANACALLALAWAAVGSSDCRQRRGKRNATDKILDRSWGEKNGKCFKIQREKVGKKGTVKSWKDADTVKTVEQSLESVLKNKPPNFHVTWDITEPNPLFTNLAAHSFWRSSIFIWSNICFTDITFPDHRSGYQWIYIVNRVLPFAAASAPGTSFLEYMGQAAVEHVSLLECIWTGSHPQVNGKVHLSAMFLSLASDRPGRICGVRE